MTDIAERVTLLADPFTRRVRLAAQITTTTGWTIRSLRTLRRAEPDAGLRVTLPPVPPSSLEAGRGVRSALRIGRATCLERSLILQMWLSSQGIERTVIVGVSTADGFSAHAWLDGEDSDGYTELTRLEQPS